ncbi:MAG: cytochrome P450 [Gammaproteobacteria bacterium]|jgi:cytochrome P450|nr:cytochrome P450 [Gammaproteobacteria bacterium]MBT5205448.1 cytochrome P450 [Gammaproteobacteria bacterium]MBT5603499.1 cytochrome P450 [Gammaproteobacteria bacterium]MBT6244530.1 cytochrome P450 [Gammaproteobacteria bacterium]
MTSTDVENQIADIPLEQIDVSQPELFQNDTVGLYFNRLRQESPVHYCPNSRFGPYWSVTRFNDIMSVDKNHHDFSSQKAGIQIIDFKAGTERVNFINMDPPIHDERRKVVTPMVAPPNLANLQDTIRQRVINILESLPRNETFDWVDLVSIELTTQMLATLFDFPFEERRKLTWWSDVASMDLTSDGPINSEQQRLAELKDCLDTFTGLLQERARKPVKNDLISMMAHSEMINMDAQEFMGTLILLIIGGNDTTRNSISGGLLALNQYPDEMRKLRSNPALVPHLIPEIIRWQTPLTSMRRTTTRAVKLGGQEIPEGEKVMMWYLSGNRDESVIPEPDRFIIDRAKPRHHLSFGFGIHRCVGNRLAELQLRILWEEILSRDLKIEVVGTPERTYSNAVRGFTKMPVRISG